MYLLLYHNQYTKSLLLFIIQRFYQYQYYQNKNIFSKEKSRIFDALDHKVQSYGSNSGNKIPEMIIPQSTQYSQDFESGSQED